MINVFEFLFQTELESLLMEQRNKIVSLQTDLTNSEEVQRDFVRLSQSLQQELERIRESGTLVIKNDHCINLNLNNLYGVR